MRITQGLHRGDDHILNSLDMRLLKLNSDFTDAQKVIKEKDYRSNLFLKKNTVTLRQQLFLTVIYLYEVVI